MVKRPLFTSKPLPVNSFSSLVNFTLLPTSSFSAISYPDLTADNVSSGNTPFDFNYHGTTPQQQALVGSPFNPPVHGLTGLQTGRGQPHGMFNMSGMAGALPDYQAAAATQLSHHDQQRFPPGTPGTTSTYQTQQFSGQSAMNVSNYAGHPAQYTSVYQQGFPIPQGSQSHPGGPGANHPPYPGGAFSTGHQQQYVLYPGHYSQPAQAPHGPLPPSYGPGPYTQQAVDMSTIGGRLSQNPFASGVSSSYGYGSGGAYLRPANMPGE